tara:strand:- start:791 stop:1429 length:639 start_codon:yes stop_codon:yes gene_type:complete
MESFKQKRANLFNENPIASHGSWISKHSIAAGSPVHVGGSGKSPLYQDDLKEGDYTVTKSTTGLGGENIATERQALIPGQEVEEYAKPGTPEYAKWEAAVKKNPSIEDKYKDRTVTQTRDVSVDSETIESPKLYPNPFQGQVKHRGITLEPAASENDSLPSKMISNIYKKANDIEGFDVYLTEHNYKRSKKQPKRGSNTRNTQNISSWATKK